MRDSDIDVEQIFLLIIRATFAALKNGDFGGDVLVDIRNLVTFESMKQLSFSGMVSWSIE